MTEIKRGEHCYGTCVMWRVARVYRLHGRVSWIFLHPRGTWLVVSCRGLFEWLDRVERWWWLLYRSCKGVRWWGSTIGFFEAAQVVGLLPGVPALFDFLRPWKLFSYVCRFLEDSFVVVYVCVKVFEFLWTLMT